MRKEHPDWKTPNSKLPCTLIASCMPIDWINRLSVCLQIEDGRCRCRSKLVKLYSDVFFVRLKWYKYERTSTRHDKDIISSTATNFDLIAYVWKYLSLSPHIYNVTLTSHRIWIPLKTKLAVTEVDPFFINTGFIVAAGMCSCATLIHILEIKKIYQQQFD